MLFDQLDPACGMLYNWWVNDNPENLFAHYKNLLKTTTAETEEKKANPINGTYLGE